MIGGAVNFLFPSSVKHLPNEEQINLLFDLTCKKRFPGFLHPSALTVNHRVDLNVTDSSGFISPQVMIGGAGDVKVRYKTCVRTSPGDIAKTLINSTFLYVAFNRIKTYILSDANNVIGFIKYQNLETCWLDSSVSLGELYTAVKHGIPLVQQFITLGRNEVCGICLGSFDVDWVDEIKYLKSRGKTEIPKTRYLLATHRDKYLLIDNIFTNSYNGDNIISVCPHCLGTGISNILTPEVNGNGINSLFFNLGTYGLLIYDAREEIIQMPYRNYFDWDLKR